MNYLQMMVKKMTVNEIRMRVKTMMMRMMRTADETMVTMRRMVEKTLITRIVNDTVVSVFDIHWLIYVYMLKRYL